MLTEKKYCSTLSFILRQFNYTVTFIYFLSPLGALEIVWFSSTPNFIIEGTTKELECIFSGWPLPREVYWYKDGELITNGTEGIYHSEDKMKKGGEETLRTKLFLPPGREEQDGYYKCTAINKISGWSSQVSTGISMIYECKQLIIFTLR